MSRRPPPIEGEPVVPRPAATVVLLRPGADGLEVLLTGRPSTMAFAAGMMVFPGGRVDPGDADPRLVSSSSMSPEQAARRLGGDVAPEAAAAFHVAAIRELFEEAGILLADPGTVDGGDAGEIDFVEARLDLLSGRQTFADAVEWLHLRPRPDLLVPIARWVTPAAYQRRFDARFFAAELTEGATASFVGDEVADHRWATPRAALDAMARHEIEMWIPTSSTLQRLVDVGSLSEVAENLAVGPVRAPSAEDLDDGRVRLTSWTAGGVPGRVVETLVLGRRELVVVDPGDPSPEALASIVGIASARAGRIVGVVISASDPYRAAGADELSERTGAPVYGPPGSAAWLPFPVEERPWPGGREPDYRRWIGLAEEP